MRPKDLPVICAYLGFFLGAVSLLEEISFNWWSIIVLIILLTYLNHLKWHFYLSGITLNLLAISLILFAFFTPSTGAFEILLRILFILSLIKFLSPLKNRDLWQIYTLNLFLFCMASITRLDLGFGFLLLAFLYISLTGLCFLTAQKTGEINIIKRPLFYFSSFFTLFVILFAIIFFICLPRSPYTFLFGFGFNPKAKTGFREKINLKKIQEIRKDKSVAFRVILSKKLPFIPYWRGIVYDTYENGSWQMHFKEKIKRKDFTCPSTYKQTIFLEPYQGKTLFAMEYPILIKPVAPKRIFIFMLKNFSISLPRNVSMRIEYKAFSCPSFPASSINPEEKNIYLQVPENIKERLKEIVKNLIKKEDSPSIIAEKIKHFLNQPPFRYSLKVNESKGDPIIDFLFSTHQGWCEHFSSALTLLLRTAGIPARLIGGYYGGIWNEMGNYYLVLQKDAHTWVEYWDGKTWKRIDPTPAHFIKKHKFLFLSKWIDYLKLRWYAYVINYDFSKQRRLFSELKRIFTPKNNWQVKYPQFKWSKKIIFLSLIPFLISTFFYFLKRKNKKTPLLQLQSILKNYGFRCPSSEGGLEWAKHIEKIDPKLSQMIKDFALNYYEVRYGKEKMDDKRKKYLNELLKEIKNYLKNKNARMD